MRRKIEATIIFPAIVLGVNIGWLLDRPTVGNAAVAAFIALIIAGRVFGVIPYSIRS